jgi:hypothetical protein
MLGNGGVHSYSCLRHNPNANQYELADSCPTCRIGLEERWEAEQLGELIAERAMWNHLETNEEHRAEMEDGK